MALRKLLVLASRGIGEIPTGDTVAALPLQPIPRAQLPTNPTPGTLAMVSDAPLVGLTLTWWNGATWVRPSALATITLL